MKSLKMVITAQKLLLEIFPELSVKESIELALDIKQKQLDQFIFDCNSGNFKSSDKITSKDLVAYLSRETPLFNRVH